MTDSTSSSLASVTTTSGSLSKSCRACDLEGLGDFGLLFGTILTLAGRGAGKGTVSTNLLVLLAVDFRGVGLMFED